MKNRVAFAESLRIVLFSHVGVYVGAPCLWKLPHKHPSSGDWKMIHVTAHVSSKHPGSHMAML